jgi:hypothetical protein
MGAASDVVRRIGVDAQVPVVGMAQAAFEFGPVAPGGLRELEGEGVPAVVGTQDAELAAGVSGLGIVVK